MSHAFLIPGLEWEKDIYKSDFFDGWWDTYWSNRIYFDTGCLFNSQRLDHFGEILTGAIELILTPLDAHSIAKDLVKLSTAALAAPVWLK